MSKSRATSTDVRLGDYALSIGNPDTPLPSGWDWVCLNDVATMATGHTPSRSHPEYWEDGDIEWLTATDARPVDGGVINSTKEKINALGLENSAAVILPKGTVCLYRSGASIGYTVILGKEMSTNQAFVNWICSDELDNRYLLHLFMAERRALFSFAEGSAQKNIFLKEIKAFHVARPPLPEQKRIVAKIEELFSDLDAGVSALERARANLRRYRASVLKSAVEGRLTKKWRKANKTNPGVEPASELLARILRERRQRWEQQQLATYESKGKKPPKNWQSKYKEPAAPDTANLPELPEGWCWATVGHLCLIDSGEAFKKKDYSDSGVRLLQIANVGFGSTLWKQRNYLPDAFAVSHAHLVMSDGDIALALNRPIIANRLKVTRLRQADLPAILYQRVARLSPINPDTSDFLFSYLRSPLALTNIRRRLQGTDQPYLNTSLLPEIPIPVPSSAEQLEINNEIEILLSIVDATDQTLRQRELSADRLRQSILKAAFEGQISNDAKQKLKRKP